MQVKTKQFKASSRSAVQQPDCLGEETVTETGGARFDALVAFFGRELFEQGICGMAGVFNDVVGFFHTASGVDVVETG